MSAISYLALGAATDPDSVGGNWNESAASRRTRLQQALASGRMFWTRPWIGPPAWTSGETVVIGAVRRMSNGQWYICSNAGTCGATEPTGLLAALYSDGGASWIHLGGPMWDTADDLAKPTISLLGNSAPAGMNAVSAWNNIGLFTLNGCYAQQYGTDDLQLRVFAANAAPTLIAGGCSIAFWSDAPKIGFRASGSGTGVRLFVDGRPVTMEPTYLGNLTTSHFTVDWGTRKPRLWEVVYDKDNTNYLFSPYITTSDQIWPYKPPVALTGAFMGDSYLQGSPYGPLLRGNSLSAHLGRLIGVDNIWRFGIGGTGLNAQGAGPYYTYVQRVPEMLSRNPDVIFTYGSTNDSGFTYAQNLAAAGTYLDTIRAKSKAPIFWFGPNPIATSYAAIRDNVDAAIAAAVAARPGQNIFYKSLVTATPPWTTGSHNNAGYSWSSNLAQYVAGDNTHEPDKGTMYLAQRMAATYANDMLPLVA